MDIDAMEAGPEMDAMVAERVMGWVRGVAGTNAGMWVDQSGKEVAVNCGHQRWSPSTNIADAWMVVEEAFNFSLHSVQDGKRGNWCKWHLANGSHVRIFEGSGKTMPLAICRAALKALSC